MKLIRISFFLFLFVFQFSFSQEIKILSGTVLVEGKAWSQAAFKDSKTNTLTIERSGGEEENVMQIIKLENIKKENIEISKDEKSETYFLFLNDVKALKQFNGNKFETDNILVPVPTQNQNEDWKLKLLGFLVDE